MLTSKGTSMAYRDSAWWISPLHRKVWQVILKNNQWESDISVSFPQTHTQSTAAISSNLPGVSCIVNETNAIAYRPLVQKGLLRRRPSIMALMSKYNTLIANRDSAPTQSITSHPEAAVKLWVKNAVLNIKYKYPWWMVRCKHQHCNSG